jgi:hypothetical protein
MRAFWISLLALVLIPQVRAESVRVCDRFESIGIEKIVSRSKSWSDVYKYSYQYSECNGQNVVEVWGAYSEIVASLLAQGPAQLKELIHLLSKDPKFEPFVLEHVSDQTIPEETLKKIRQNIDDNCPKEAGRLCSRIRMATQ